MFIDIQLFELVDYLLLGQSAVNIRHQFKVSFTPTIFLSRGRSRNNLFATCNFERLGDNTTIGFLTLNLGQLHSRDSVRLDSVGEDACEPYCLKLFNITDEQNLCARRYSTKEVESDFTAPH